MKMKLFLTSFLSTLAFLPGILKAQTTVIPVETSGNALVLRVEANKDLHTVYYGKRLTSASEYALVSSVYRQPSDPSGMFNSAYTSSGSRNLIEPAITVTHADGNFSLDLKFVSQQTTKIND